MKMKKILAMGASFALVAALAIGGTMAYFTDDETVTNIAVSGKVNVELNELQRNAEGTALEKFEQGKDVLPIVGSAQGTADEYGITTAGNFVDKIVYATNTGTTDAYMRIIVAIPTWANTATENDTASANNLHWNYPSVTNQTTLQGKITEQYGNVFDGDSENSWELSYDMNNKVEIDGAKYWLFSFTFEEAIPAGESTDVVMTGFYLDQRVDYDPDTNQYIDVNGRPIEDFNGVVSIPVYVQAVQKDGFTDAETALKEAFDGDVEDWFSNVALPAVVADADSLEEALTTEEYVILNDNINVGDQVFVVNGGTLDGAGNTLTVSSGTAAYESGLTVTEGIAKNVTVTGAFRGLGVGGSGASEMTGDVTYENVTVTGATYGVNIGVGNAHKLTMIDCTFGD